MGAYFCGLELFPIAGDWLTILGITSVVTS